MSAAMVSGCPSIQDGSAFGALDRSGQAVKLRVQEAGLGGEGGGVVKCDTTLLCFAARAQRPENLFSPERTWWAETDAAVGVTLAPVAIHAT